MIKVFRIDGMRDTPFASEAALNVLQEQNILATDKLNDSDVIVSFDYKKLIPYLIKYRSKKRYLVWTHEPRYNTHFTHTISPLPLFPKIHIMNIYTKNIYLNNFTVWGYKIDRLLSFMNKESFSKFSNKKVVAIMSYQVGSNKSKLIKDGQNIDLYKLRNEIALFGYHQGKADIYGKNWPQNVSIENSRSGNWSGRKSEILQEYNFNLCFENTNFDYYCTEKIWDSIKNYCLPIYYGKNNKIYEIFPKRSFIDYAEFDNPEELYTYIQKITIEEFIERMNLCIKVFNDFYLKGHQYWSQMYIEMLTSTANKIKDITQ